MSIKNTIKKLLFFQEPEKIENFVINESEDEQITDYNEDNKQDNKLQIDKQRNEQNSENKTDTENAGNDEENKNGIKILKSKKDREKEKKGDNSRAKDSQDDEDKGIQISNNLENSLEYIKKIYSVPVNSDIVIREFSIIVKEKVIDAFAVFIDGMTNTKIVIEAILKPLMLHSSLEIKSNDSNKSVEDYIKDHLLPQTQMKIVRTYDSVIDGVNIGECGIFVDGLNIAFLADVKGWEHRSVERPNTEIIIKGPQEGFTELLRVNTALIRKIIKNENLIVESISVGKSSKTPCSLLYIKNVANDSLVNEIRNRLKSINVEYILDTGELEQYIEDNTFINVPQIIDTERPDKVAMHLIEGRVAILMNGSPFALIMPANLPEFIKSPEDSYIRYPFANFLRIIRLLAIILNLLLPGLYIAIINYHQEMIPTDLMLAIEATSEKVPFPSIIELLILEVSFELIREAGIRVPSPIGPTLGIIGALILGQAAVAANIVSPILIIIVAITGIGSFAIPNFSLAFGVRIARFAYIFLGAVAGFLGIATGLFINGILLAAVKSFGVPFLTPITPKVSRAKLEYIFRSPIWKQEWRPDYLNVKKGRSQPNISRGWVEEKKNKGEEQE